LSEDVGEGVSTPTQVTLTAEAPGAPELIDALFSAAASGGP
jgi:hypothetical protein